MFRPLYILSAVLLISWAAGFFLLNAGIFIHVLPVLAVLFSIVNVVQDRRKNRHPAFKPMQLNILK